MPLCQGSGRIVDRQLAYIPAIELDWLDFVALASPVAWTSLDHHCLAVLLGEGTDGPVVCWRGCCLRAAAGGVVLVPDVLVAEFVANGLPVPATLALRRPDGRAVWLFASGGQVRG